MATRIYKPPYCLTIQGVVRRAIEMAEEDDQPVAFEFNNVEMVVKAGDDPDAVVESYFRRLYAPPIVREVVAMSSRERRLLSWGFAAGAVTTIIVGALVSFLH